MKINNETKVGLLGAISITLLILGFTFLKDTKIFQKNFILYAKYKNVNGLASGSPVFFNGLRVGQVRDLQLDKKEGSITVSFNVDETLNVPVDSKAMIYDADILGSKAMKIVQGSSAQAAKSGLFLEGTIDKSLSDQVKEELLPLKDKLQELLSQLEKFVGWMNVTMDETNGNRIDKIMENFAGVSDDFKRITVKVDSLTGSAQGAVSKTNSILANIKNQNENISKIVGNVGTFSDSLVVATSDIRRVLNRTSSAVAEVEGLMGRINNGENSIGKLVNDTLLYHNVNSAVYSLDSLVKSLTEDPSFHLYHHIGTKWNSPEEKRALKERQDDKKGKKESGNEGGNE